MATVQVFTKARMFAIEQAAFIAARLVSYNLILTRKNGEDLNLGNVRGAQGSAGTNGTNGSNGLTPTLRGTSTTSQAITVGSKTFAVSGLNVAFPIEATVKIQAALPQNYMVGLVTASTTASVTVNVLEVNGSGTFASWTITLGSFTGTRFFGTTGQRNAMFPLPTTDAQKVALANSGTTWHNSDFDWDERYYAPATLAGVLGPGLMPGAEAGWYPVSNGPRAVVFAAGSQALPTNGIFTNWRDWGGTAVHRQLRSWKNTPGNLNDGSAMIHRASGNGAIQIFLAGRYRLSATMLSYNNATLAFWVVPTVDPPRRRWLQINAGTTAYGEFSDIFIGPGDYIMLQNMGGASTVGGDHEDHVAIEYLGPPLYSL